MTTSDDFARRVQDLPAELFNMVVDLVFMPSESEVTIDKNYKPPKELSISRATRKRFAVKYYGTTTFNTPSSDMTVFTTWLSRLSQDHQRSLKRVHFVTNCKEDDAYVRSFSTPDLLQSTRGLFQLYLNIRARSCPGTALSPDCVLSMLVPVREEGDTIERLNHSKFVLGQYEHV